MVILGVVWGGHFSEKTSVGYLRTDLSLNNPCNIPCNMALERSIKVVHNNYPKDMLLTAIATLKLIVQCWSKVSHI